MTTESETEHDFVEDAEFSQMIGTLAMLVAQGIEAETELSIRANALVNRLCPDCLALEVFGVIFLNKILHQKSKDEPLDVFIANQVEIFTKGLTSVLLAQSADAGHSAAPTHAGSGKTQ